MEPASAVTLRRRTQSSPKSCRVCMDESLSTDCYSPIWESDPPHNAAQWTRFLTESMHLLAPPSLHYGVPNTVCTKCRAALHNAFELFKRAAESLKFFIRLQTEMVLHEPHMSPLHTDRYEYAHVVVKEEPISPDEIVTVPATETIKQEPELDIYDVHSQFECSEQESAIVETAIIATELNETTDKQIAQICYQARTEDYNELSSSADNKNDTKQIEPSHDSAPEQASMRNQFLDNLRHLVKTTDIPIDMIFEDLLKSNPEGGKTVNLITIKRYLEKIRSFSKQAILKRSTLIARKPRTPSPRQRKKHVWKSRLDLFSEPLAFKFTPGATMNSRLLYAIEEKQLYRLRSKLPQFNNYQCYMKGCRARVALFEGSEMRQRTNRFEHNHSSTAEERCKQNQFLDTLKKVIKTTDAPIDEVFNYMRRNDDAGQNIFYSKVRRNLCKIRANMKNTDKDPSINIQITRSVTSTLTDKDPSSNIQITRSGTPTAE